MEKDTGIRKISLLPVTCHLWVKEYFPHLPPRYAENVLRIQMCNKNTALLEDDIKADMYLIHQVITAKCAAGCQ